MLVPDLAAYTCDRQEFLLLARTEEEAPALHYRFLNRRVDLPLHPSWAAWLWERGLNAGEVEALESLGVYAYRCRPAPRALQEDISQAVRRLVLAVPLNAEPAAKATGLPFVSGTDNGGGSF
jgi:hypothetical protein